MTSSPPIASPRIAMIGLGYVGLPLAVVLARHFTVIGFDVDQGRIDELRRGHDRTNEIREADLRGVPITLTDDPEKLKGAEVYIVTVPTPVDERCEPDLGAVRAACATVGSVMSKGAVVVFESTVYPGVTEDICGPALEEASGLVCGTDFFLGYSPERINPGDREHTVDKITKVIAGQTPEVVETLRLIYGRMTNDNLFEAADIRTAEAAKVIENAQRDINIAFVNEVSMIFQKLGLSVHDVLEAAGTKWNFLDFKPGLVGGHCIGIDPFYLAHCAQENGHHPEIILAGRRINDGMGAFVADRVVEKLRALRDGRERFDILALGLTFKENVPDLRNSRVVDVVSRLKELGMNVVVHDPMADPEEARREYGIELIPTLDDDHDYDCLLALVPHDTYRGFSPEVFSRLVRDGGLVADLKDMWKDAEVPAGLDRWRL